MEFQTEAATFMSEEKSESPASRSLLRRIAADVHFWIPLGVLIGGLLLLEKLR